MMWGNACGPGTPTNYTYFFNPANPTVLYRLNDILASDIFCGGMSWNTSGQLVVAGGDVMTGQPDHAYRFMPAILAPPATGYIIPGTAWREVNTMSFPRWYPSVLTLAREDIPASGFVDIPGGSSLALGGGSLSAHPETGNEYWQALLPTGPNWSHTLQPDTPGSLNHGSVPGHENYYRSGTPLPEPVIDYYPRVLQLANTGTASAGTHNIFIAGDMEVTGNNPPGASWVIKPRYPSAGPSIPNWQLWYGPSAASGAQSNDRYYGSCVLLHYPSVPGGLNRVLVFGGAQNLGGAPPNSNWQITKTVQEFEVQAGDPKNGQWIIKVNSASSPDGLIAPRFYTNAVVLPVGSVLLVGGTTQVNSTNPNSGVPLQPIDHQPELYDPGAPGASLATSALMVSSNCAPFSSHSYPRLYHNVALLLPDATVLSLGGSWDASIAAQGYADGRFSGEIFTPPYLGYGFRPSIVGTTSDDIAFSTGTPTTFGVSVQHDKIIDAFVLLRPGAVTHDFDADQRLIDLTFGQPANEVPGIDTFVVTAPTDDLGPAGYYMLFAVEHDPAMSTHRVPSMARFIRLH
jgi:hypothetical protein